MPTCPMCPTLLYNPETMDVVLHVAGKPEAWDLLTDVLKNGRLHRSRGGLIALSEPVMKWLQAQLQASPTLVQRKDTPASSDEEKAEHVRHLIAQASGAGSYGKVGFWLVATSSAIAVAEAAGSFWLFDVIDSYLPKLRAHDYMVWTLTFPDPKKSACDVICTVDDRQVIKQHVPDTDFPLKEGMTLLVARNEANKFTVMLEGDD